MKTRWQTWVMLAFGVWLFLSPFWMQGYAATNSIAAWNSYVFGVLVAAFAIGALGAPRRWEEWLELAFGIWLLISPFVLVYFHTETGAAWNTAIVGILIGIDAIWLLAQRPRPQVTT